MPKMHLCPLQELTAFPQTPYSWIKGAYFKRKGTVGRRWERGKAKEVGGMRKGREVQGRREGDRKGNEG